MANFVSRAGKKLDHALTVFGIDVSGFVCADFGCNTGGFTDCLLRRGAAKVYSIDTGYGVLDWKLRNDPRVIVMERTNAMHVKLPEAMDLICIDVAWTRQKNILPAARQMLDSQGIVVTLVKPHYEAEASQLRKGVLAEEKIPAVLNAVKLDVERAGFSVAQDSTSPIKGAKGNSEFLWLLKRDQ